MKTIALWALIPLAACAPKAPSGEPVAPPPAAVPADNTAASTPDADRCGASKAAPYIGRMAPDVAATIKTLSGAERLRVYRSGDPVTMDYSPMRLNVETDERGRIVKLSCG